MDKEELKNKITENDKKIAIGIIVGIFIGVGITKIASGSKIKMAYKEGYVKGIEESLSTILSAGNSAVQH